MTGEIVKQENLNPGQLLTLAVNQNLDIEKLERLMDLQNRWETEQNRKSFFEALAKFQSEVPEIRKNKKVKFETQKGTTDYNYAPLADVIRQIKDTCKDCGLSYRWEISDTKEEIKVTCLVTHVNGHTEKTTMTASPDDSGSKNKIQSRGSAIEYLKRYTLIGALGLSTTDSDVDGIVPEISLDILHKTFIEDYNKLIQMDSTYTRIHPDNWKGEKTQKVYMKAIAEVRRILVDKTPKKA
jgi:hypothetical protein